MRGSRCQRCRPDGIREQRGPLERAPVRPPGLAGLLDLGYVDLGFDPRNEIVRVHAHLGDQKTLIKEWLAACLWHNLSGGGNPSGLVIQQALNEKAKALGISTRSWMDEVLELGHIHE